MTVCLKLILPAFVLLSVAASGAFLRTLTADTLVIAPDGSARVTGGSYIFEPVRDGHPSPPRLTDHPGVKSRHSLAIEVPTDSSGAKERFEYKIAQARDPDGLHFDNARFSRFCFQVAAPAAPFLGSAIIFQAWQGYPYGPPVSLKIVRGESAPYTLKLAVRNMNTGPDSRTPDVEVWSRAMIQPNVWYTVTVYIEPRFESNGQIRLWIDGVSRADWRGPIGYDPAKVAGAYAGLDIKNGLYQPDANNGHTIYFDQIFFATEL